MNKLDSKENLNNYQVDKLNESETNNFNNKNISVEKEPKEIKLNKVLLILMKKLKIYLWILKNTKINI